MRKFFWMIGHLILAFVYLGAAGFCFFEVYAYADTTSSMWKAWATTVGVLGVVKAYHVVYDRM